MVMCAVSGCKSSNDTRLKRNRNKSTFEHVKFFRFPRNAAMQQIWVSSCNRKDTFNASNSYICAKHFKPEDYGRNLRHELLNYQPRNSRTLKIDAIPTLHMRQELEVIKFKDDDATMERNVLTDRAGNKIFITEDNIRKNSIQDSSSEDDGPRLLIPTGKTVPMECRRSPEIFTKSSNGDQSTLTEIRLKLLDHVIMAWVNRGRAGDRSIVMLDSMLKSKAKETAEILRTNITTPNKWLLEFKEKLRRKDAKGPPKVVPGNPSMNIVDIIGEEWPQFRNGECSPENSDSEEPESPIENTHEALECLRLVEEYALCVRNLPAVLLIGQMEEILNNGERV